MKSNNMTVEVAKKLVEIKNKETDKRNKAFAKLKPSEQRVAIALDVLGQIKLKRIVARSKVWVRPDGNSESFSNADLKENKELADIYGKAKSCDACALGAMFVCAVQVNDNLKVCDIEHIKTGKDYEGEKLDPYANKQIHLHDIEKYLGNFFSKKHLRLIEVAYESGDGGYEVSENDYETDDDLDALNFFKCCDDFEYDVDDHDRMRLIMENIVVNKGKFTPSKRPQLKAFTPGFDE